MSVDQVKNYIVPYQKVPDSLQMSEHPSKACQICPDWFWAKGPWNVKYCTQCVVDMMESDWKLRTVLRMTQLYKKWMQDIDESDLESPRKETLMLELKFRLYWLQERQEFIRLETSRMAREMEMGHRLDCMCQSVSVWQQLARPPSGLMVHMDSDLGVTIGDPSANTHG